MLEIVILAVREIPCSSPGGVLMYMPQDISKMDTLIVLFLCFPFLIHVYMYVCAIIVDLKSFSLGWFSRGAEWLVSTLCMD